MKFIRKIKGQFAGNPLVRWWLTATVGIVCFWMLTPILVFVIVHWMLPEGMGRELASLGQFGDLFGAIKAIFSGFAFVGVMISLLVQQREITMSTQLGAVTAALNVLPSMIHTELDGVLRMEDQLRSLGIEGWGAWTNLQNTTEGLGYWEKQHIESQRQLETAKAENCNRTLLRSIRDMCDTEDLLLAHAKKLKLHLQEQDRLMTFLRERSEFSVSAE